MGPVRQRPAALKAQEAERRQRLFTYAPKIEAADHRREERTELFQRDDPQAGAKGAIRAWCTRVRASGLAEFESVLGTIDRWLEEITTSCQARQTRGLVEGFNHRVKGLKRRCYGLFNVGRLCQRLTLDLHGYQRFGHT